MKTNVNNENIHQVDFDSLSEFYHYIKNTPTNKTWGDAEKSLKERFGESTNLTKIQSMSESDDKKHWTGTKSLEEAEELFINGIPDTSKKLTQMLRAEKKLQPEQTMRRVNSIQGFQPVVPLYLMGVPNNMISMQMKPVKQKVVNLYSNISYLCNVSSERINEECIKKFRLISKLESQNYRVNLYLIFGSRVDVRWNIKQGLVTTIKLKSANERLNVSKLAFPLTHPSMERRLLFRLMEVYPTMDKKYLSGYGRSFQSSILNKLYPDGYILPEFITKDIDTIKSLDELKYL